LANALHPAHWLPTAFFDTGSEEHAFWSILSFKTWITVYKPHVHAASGTVFGGPLGVRNLVFALSRMHQNLDFAKRHESPPRDILLLIRGPRRVWSESDARRELDSCVAALRTDIARTCTILQVTYEEQLLAWCAAIIHSAENLTGLATANQTEIGISATSGVPTTAHLIRAMYQEIATDLQEDSNIEEGASHPVTLRVGNIVSPPAGSTRVGGPPNVLSDPGNGTGMCGELQWA
jgi:hypothetical protein